MQQFSDRRELLALAQLQLPEVWSECERETTVTGPGTAAGPDNTSLCTQY